MNKILSCSQNTSVQLIKEKFMTNTQTKRRANASTIAIITLSVLLIATIGIGIALAFFTGNANVFGVLAAAIILIGMIYLLVRSYKEATTLSERAVK